MPACHSSCTAGLGQCTGFTENDCCSYYDEDMCVAECIGNQHFDENFTCVCNTFYEEPNCDSKPLNNEVQLCLY